jgi:hypothetical protein
MDSIVTSASATRRLARAAAWLGAQSPREQVLVVGATAEAAAEVVRACPLPAAFGWHRLTLGRLAALLAAEELGSRGLAPLGTLGVEAVCARLIHAQRGALGKLEPIATQPGLSRALARSLQDLESVASVSLPIPGETQLPVQFDETKRSFMFASANPTGRFASEATSLSSRTT